MLNAEILHTILAQSTSENTKIKKVKKGEILQEEGSQVHKVFYVKSGLLRSYTIDDQGKIHIFMFAPEGWIISDIQAHTFSEPTELFIDALEPSEVLILQANSFQNIDYQATNFADLADKLLRRLSVLQKRVIMLMSASAKERYEHFIETYPQLIHRVPLKMIASYLGITPVALSNIRRKIKNE